MTRGIYNRQRDRATGLIAILSLAAVCFSSCQKKFDQEGKHITGVFMGENCHSTPIPPVTVRQNNDLSVIVFTAPVGVSTVKQNCTKYIDFTGKLAIVPPKAGVLDDNFVIDTIYVTDGCNKTVKAHGTGFISGHKLYYSIYFDDTAAKPVSTYNACYTGFK